MTLTCRIKEMMLSNTPLGSAHCYTVLLLF